jgi:beta-glucanase (GH16 family)
MLTYNSIYFKILSSLIFVSASVFPFAQETTYTGIEFTGMFGGTSYDGNYYSFPSGSEVWGGFANEDVSIYPLSFTDGGEITFMGSTAGSDAEVYFRFEYNPYPDTEPSFNTISVTVSGMNDAPYSIDIPSQGENTYSSFLLYVATPDSPVSLTDVSLTATFASTDVYGCIDPLAIDYNINATSQLMDQNGNVMCTYNSCENTPGNGCMYTNSFGPFNEWFGSYECELYGGISCTGEIEGCTDTAANNYNPNATNDDGSCNYQTGLVWSDEFEASNLDPTKWDYDIGQGSWGWGNNELQYYTNSISNVMLDNGYLRITAKNEQFGAANYTSARIKTKGLFEFTYGRVEARIQVPIGQGLWPAFWMLGGNIDDVSWPQCGEIDIMEHINTEALIHGTHHYNNNGHQYSGGSTVCNAGEFNVYSIEWSPLSIKWFLNESMYYEADISSNAVSKEEFHEPFFFLINLAVGGNWPGSPNASTPFPSVMLVDYVRVYQENVGCGEDIDNDGLVTVGDILLVLTEYGCTTSCTQDVNVDGVVNVSDILLILAAFGVEC